MQVWDRRRVESVEREPPAERHEQAPLSRYFLVASTPPIDKSMVVSTFRQTRRLRCEMLGTCNRSNAQEPTVISGAVQNGLIWILPDPLAQIRPPRRRRCATVRSRRISPPALHCATGRAPANAPPRPES